MKRGDVSEVEWLEFRRKNQDALLRHTYNITLKQRDAMERAQEYRCAICQNEEPIIDPRSGQRRHLAVDHDHKTGENRALICSSCNLTLGHLKDCPERLLQLIQYPARHESIRRSTEKIR